MVTACFRFPLLALGIAALFCGVWAGLLRFGWSLPQGRANMIALHGPLMVFGFLGTVISLERAVALRRPWGFLAPAAPRAGAGLLHAGVREGIGELVLLLAGCVLVGLFVVIMRAHATASTATLLLGALLWVVGNALWLHGDPLVQVVPWWAGFLVLTIVGERLELAAMGRLTGRGRAIFVAFTLFLLAGLSLSAADAGTGIRVAGAALLGYALWLRDGAAVAGFEHDAELHALFLGFVFSMIFGHAPVIFPGVLGIAIPFRRPFYIHLALLHAGLALRVGGDLAGNFTAARWGGLLNATAIGLFLVATLASAAVARLRPKQRAARTPSRQPVGVKR
jgi:hypothetical protein